MAAKFWVNLTDVSVGENAIEGVQSVSVAESGSAESLYGDGDIYPLEVRNNKRTVTSTIITNDLNHGVRQSDSFVKVSFTALQGADQNSSVAGVVNDGVVTGVTFNPAHNGPANSTITVQHTSADGLASPLTLS